MRRFAARFQHLAVAALGALVAVALAGAGTSADAQNVPPFVFIASPTSGTPGPGIDSIEVLIDEPIEFSAVGEDDGTIVGWFWDFGDGRTSTLQDPGFLSYAAPGRYVVFVRAADDEGALSVPDTVVIQVRRLPVIEILTPAQGSQQRQRFTVTGKATPGGIIRVFVCSSCSIDGDSTIAAADSSWSFPDVLWSEPGVDQTLGVTVEDSLGLGNETVVGFEVLPNVPPTAAIVSPIGEEIVIAAGDSLFFAGTASDPDGTIVERLWFLVEDVVGVGDTLGWRTFPDPGTYRFFFIVTDDVGESGSASVEVTVVANARPVATIVAPAGDTTIVLGDAVTFAATASDADGTVVSVRWDLGDGTVLAQLTPPPYTYADSGRYVVVFTATDDLGAVSLPDTVILEVRARPVVRVVAPTEGATLPASFDIVGRASPGAVVRIAQCTGCSAPGAERTAAVDSTFAFADIAWAASGPGNSFQLVARSPYGLEDSTTVTFTVEDNLAPTVTIVQPAGAVTIAIADSVRFVAAATDPEGGTLVVRWTFAPGDTVLGVDGGYRRFDASGTFTVVVRATDAFGAFAEDSVAITVTGRGPNVDRTSPGSADRVDGHDVIFVLRALVTQDLRADVNGDGVVDATDVALVRAAFASVTAPALRRTP